MASLNDHLRSQRVDVAVAGFLEAVERGAQPDREAYLAQYADIAAELREFFDDYLSVNRIMPGRHADTSGKGARSTGGTRPSSAPPLPLPRRFGDFELLEEIARGGMGVVYKARQRNPERIVALKMILAGQFASQADVDRFSVEAHAAAALDHPNIVPIFEVGQHEGQPYFTMGYVSGESLAQRLATGPLPAREAATIIADVARAVHDAHRQGIVHRDLKPANILLDSDGRVRVTDFGLAKRQTDPSSLTRSGQLLGTPSFMSPEQVLGDPKMIGPASDVYSLGATLYALVTGRPPFHAARTIDTLKQVIDRDPVPPREFDAAIPRDLETIVLKALAKEPAARYRSAEEMADDLRRFQADRPILARRSTPRERFIRWCRRNPAVASLAGTVAALLLAAVAILAISNARIRTHAEKSEQVAQFLKDTLGAAGPSVARGRDATLLREILDMTTQRVQKDLDGQPEVQGDLWLTLGNTYADIGDVPHTVGTFERAVDSYRRAFGSQNSKLALALGRLGQFRSFTGNVAMGNATARSGLDMARTCGDPETLAQCLACVANSFEEAGIQPPEGEPFWREAVLLRRKLDNDPVQLANCLRGLGGTVEDTDEGEASLREALALFMKHLGPDHPKVANATYGLGQSLLKRDKLPEAEAVLRQAITLYRKVHDKGHVYQSHVRFHTVLALAGQHKWAEADAFMQAEKRAWEPCEWHCVAVRLKVCQGDWEGAWNASNRAIQEFPGPGLVSVGRLVVLMQAGHQEELRSLCQETLRHDVYWKARYGAAQVALTVPVDGDLFDFACRTADEAVAPPTQKHFWPLPMLVKALAEYRRNRFDSAIEYANRVITGPNPDKPSLAHAWVIQAMSYAGRKQWQEARSALTKGEEIIRQPHLDFVDDFGGGYGLWTITKRLRCEAEAMVQPENSPDSL